MHADSGNDLYDRALQALRERNNRAPKAKGKGAAPVLSTAEREQAAKDYYASVRTNVSSRRLYSRLVASLGFGVGIGLEGGV